MYINVGALILGRRPKSKKELKLAIATMPSCVYFDGTSSLGPQFSGTPDMIPKDVILSVVGPDPYHTRNWYGNVTRKGGKVTVK